MEIIKFIISSLVSLMIGTLFGGWLERLLYRPKLAVEFDTDLLYFSNDGVGVCLVVSNNGRVAAQDCVGLITINNVERTDLLKLSDLKNKLVFPLSQNEPLSHPDSFRKIDRELLCWAHYGNPYKYTINPGAKTLLDVFYAINYKERNEWYLVIPSEEGWDKARAILKNQEYHGSITISPANAKPTVKQFTIKPYNENTKGPLLILK